MQQHVCKITPQRTMALYIQSSRLLITKLLNYQSAFDQHLKDHDTCQQTLKFKQSFQEMPCE